MDDVEVHLRRWGNSPGAAVPADVVRTNSLQAGSSVRLRIATADLRLRDIHGQFSDELRAIDIETGLREMDEGWRDD